jgi:hypothetical protein
MRNLLLLSIVISFIAACSKTEDVKITGNVPPPDHTIDSSTISIYVNKAYINLLGREPVGSERNEALTILRQNNFSLDNRKQFITTLFSRQEYIRNLYNVANNEYLRNLDSLEIEGQIFVFNNLLGMPQYAAFFDAVNFELNRLDTLKKTLSNVYGGTMDYRAMLSRMTNNYFYDQINMGSENFVVSTYQNFLFRYPSDGELLAGKIMVDGNTSTIFFKQGKSKYDYINIFFETDDYYEGQVRFIFKKYLFREPSSAEIYLYANLYKNTNDYKQLQKEVFSLDEYAGIQ